MLESIKMVYGAEAVEEQAFIELVVGDSTKVVVAWNIIEYPTLAELEEHFKDDEIELLYLENTKLSA